MGFYRFMSTNNLDLTLAGNLRFRRFSYYRLLEILRGDEADLIGDRDDGVSYTKTGRLDFSEEGLASELQDKLHELNISVPNGSSVVIEDATFVHACDGFLLSFSRGEYEEFKDVMLDDDYDACVRFDDIQLIANEIYEKGVIKDLGKVCDYFEPPVCGDVEYADNVAFIENSPVLGYAPFLKREKFKGQSESRIIFTQKKEFPDDYFDVVVDFPAGYLVEQLRGVVKVYDGKEDEVDPKQLLDFLSEVHRFLVDGITPQSAQKLSADELIVFATVRFADKEVWLNAEGRKKKIVEAYWALRESDPVYVDRTLESYFCSAHGDWFHLGGRLKSYFLKLGDRLRARA